MYAARAAEICSLLIAGPMIEMDCRMELTWVCRNRKAFAIFSVYELATTSCHFPSDSSSSIMISLSEKASQS